MEKKKRRNSTAIFSIVSVVIGFFLGVFGYDFIERLLPETGGVERWLRIGAVILLMAVSFVLHVFLHEAGHLIAGKLSGYRFVSFRVFNTMFVKVNGKMVRKRYGIPGTLGQCGMSPPEPVGGEYPYIFYNLGGGLINILAGGILLIPALFAKTAEVQAGLYIFAFSGFIFGLLNLIPVKAGGIANDGYNIMLSGKRPEARRSLWVMLRIGALLAEGRRLRDMPDEWFVAPGPSELANTMISSIAYLRFCRLMDRMELKQAGEYGQYLLNKADTMLELHKNELRCELLFMEIIGPGRKHDIDRLYTKPLRKYIAASSMLLSRPRLLYAYAKAVSGDQTEAANMKKRFEKLCSSYPHAGEIEGERELMALIK